MQHNGWGESIPTAEQTLGRDLKTRGPTACFATDWHAGYRAGLCVFPVNWLTLSARRPGALCLTGIGMLLCACGNVGWSRPAVLDFMNEVNLTGIETDGQFEGIPCADTTHDHHHNGIEGTSPVWVC